MSVAFNGSQKVKQLHQSLSLYAQQHNTQQHVQKREGESTYVRMHVPFCRLDTGATLCIEVRQGVYS